MKNYYQKNVGVKGGTDGSVPTSGRLPKLSSGTPPVCFAMMLKGDRDKE